MGADAPRKIDETSQTLDLRQALFGLCLSARDFCQRRYLERLSAPTDRCTYQDAQPIPTADRARLTDGGIAPAQKTRVAAVSQRKTQQVETGTLPKAPISQPDPQAAQATSSETCAFFSTQPTRQSLSVQTQSSPTTSSRTLSTIPFDALFGLRLTPNHRKTVAQKAHHVAKRRQTTWTRDPSARLANGSETHTVRSPRRERGTFFRVGGHPYLHHRDHSRLDHPSAQLHPAQTHSNPCRHDPEHQRRRLRKKSGYTARR